MLQNLLLKKRNRRILFFEVIFPTLLIYIQASSHKSAYSGAQITKAAFNYPGSLVDTSFSTYAARSAFQNNLCADSQLCQPLFGGKPLMTVTNGKGATVSMATAVCQNVTADVAAILASHGGKGTPKAAWASPARCVEGDLVYADASDLQSAATNLAYDNKLWGAVELTEAGHRGPARRFSYTLRFPNNNGDFPDVETKLQPVYEAVGSDQTSAYQSTGFLAMQWLVERCLGDISQCIGTAPHGTPYAPVRFASFPTPESKTNPLLDSLFCMGGCGENSQPSKGSIAFGGAQQMVEAIAFVVAFFLRAVVDERKEKRKELLQIMGLESSVFLLSWITTYVLQLAVCTLVWVR